MTFLAFVEFTYSNGGKQTISMYTYKFKKILLEIGRGYERQSNANSDLEQ